MGYSDDMKDYNDEKEKIEIRVLMKRKTYNDILNKAFAYEYLFFRANENQQNFLKQLKFEINSILINFGYPENQMDSIQIRREIITKMRPFEWSTKIFG